MLNLTRHSQCERLLENRLVQMQNTLKRCVTYSGRRLFPLVLQSVSVSSQRLRAEEIRLVIGPLMTAGLIDFRSAEMRRNNVRIHPQRQSESNESRKQPTARVFLSAGTQNRPHRDKSSRSDPAMLDELKRHAQKQVFGPHQRGRTSRAK